ncbi:MAG: nuclear transport factor 2 family protein [Pseudomonadota bacterium]
MKTAHHFAAALLAPVLALSEAIAERPSSPEAPETPRAVVDAFHQALEAGSSADVLSLLTRNVVFFEMGAAENSRREYEQMHLASDVRQAKRAKLRRLSRRVSGSKDVRWVLSVYRIEDGTNVNARMAETVILRNKSGKWRIAHIHWSETPFSP